MSSGIHNKVACFISNTEIVELLRKLCRISINWQTMTVNFALKRLRILETDWRPVYRSHTMYHSAFL